MRPPAAYPRVVSSRTGSCSLLGLAPGGVCQASQVTLSAGALLPHRFTLTCRQIADRRFTFCCTFPDLAIGGRYPPPCPVVPGLSSRHRVTSHQARHGDRRPPDPLRKNRIHYRVPTAIGGRNISATVGSTSGIPESSRGVLVRRAWPIERQAYRDTKMDR